MTFRPSSSPGVVVSALIVLTIMFIAGIVRIKRQSPDVTRVLESGQGEGAAHARYIAQTALDRSVKELVADPKWRDGFADVPFESGTYTVRIYDAETGDRGEKISIPPNYVRIVVSGEVDGVTKEVEAVWVDALSAFQHTYAAGNRIEIANHRGRRLTALGSLSNNAWHQGRVTIAGGATLYGSVASAGDVVIGSGGGRAIVCGSVRASSITLEEGSAIRRLDNLNEAEEGIDLNGDGDANDIGVGGGRMRVHGATSVRVGGRRLRPGDTDSRIARGSIPVSVGGEGIGAIIDPRPDFSAYYELVTGLASYPPPVEHIQVAIAGDGDGHYFASAADFTEWLDKQTEKRVVCWRCAGDGRIDPRNGTECPTCNGAGKDIAVEVSGVFYVDDATVDLGGFGRNLVLHGTVVVAQGDPYRWPEREVNVPGGTATIDHFPPRGRFVLAGENRMHFTQTYRSKENGGPYIWKECSLFRDDVAQTLPIPVPMSGHAMRDFPAVIAASQIEIAPRRAGFAYHPGDIGDERMTVLQGVLYAEDDVTLHGQGGWTGDVVFDETLERSADDALEEAVLNVDLNGDSDIFDRVDISAITVVPVVRVSRGRYNVDINNDGVLREVTIGADYLGFFDKNDYSYPVLVYLEGVVLGQTIHTCEQSLAVFDEKIGTQLPFGFEVNFGSSTYQGLISWWERQP